MKTVSKWFGYLDKPERVPAFMRRAFTMLRSGRPGPVILAIPDATGTYDDTADPLLPVKGTKSTPARPMCAPPLHCPGPAPTHLRRGGRHLCRRLRRLNRLC